MNEARQQRPTRRRAEARRLPGRILLVLVALGAATIAASTLMAALAERWWIADLFTHFRVQYLAAASVLLIAGGLLRQRVIVTAMLVCVAINGWAVRGDFVGSAVSPTPAAQAAGVGSDRTVRLISVNVRRRNMDPTGLVELIEAESPDIVLVLEHSEHFARALDAFRDSYPYRLSAPSLGPFGIAFYSRIPVADLELIPLGPTEAIRARLELPGGDVPFFGVHLRSPSSETWALQRNEQLQQLAGLVSATDGLVLVCGDLNTTRYSPYFRSFVDATGLADSGAGRGIFWTWPTYMRPFGIQIDHCLGSAGIDVENVTVLGDVGSDHYPLLIEFSAGRNG